MKLNSKSRSSLAIWTFLSMTVIAGLVSVVFAGANDAKYVGVEKCKNCHEAKNKGNQYGKWNEMKHSKAYETLASDEAKEIGQKQGIADPQKSDKCLKCHVTAFDKPADSKDKKFDSNLGVQCEQCHGPGGKHVKARLAEAAEEEGDDLFGDVEDDELKELPPGEISAKVEEASCKECHNKESPTFEEFNFEERKKEMAHPDPRKK
jgi:hypothetical protein